MDEPAKRAGLKFGIGGMLLLTLVFAIMGAAARQFVLSVRQGTPARAPFVIFTLAAPMIVVALMGTGYQLLQWLRHTSRKL